MSHLDIGDIVHSDCAYKCTWNSYPVTLMGFSDENCKLDPTIIAIAPRETHSEFTDMLQTWKNVNLSLHFRYRGGVQLKLRDDAISFFTLGEGWGGRGLKSCVVEKYLIILTLNSLLTLNGPLGGHSASKNRRPFGVIFGGGHSGSKK